MAQIEWATVVSNTTVNDKFRENHRVRVINVTVGDRQNKEAIWFKNPSSFAFLEPGIQIQTIRNEKGKLSILETSPPRQVNGNGLLPIEEPIKQNSGAYQVSNLGKVRNKKSKILKPYLTRGYERVSLYHKKGRQCFLVHRLVASVFIPNPERKPDVNHINGCKTDNNVSNLE